MRASSDNVQHFVFVFVQTVRVSGSSYLKEVGGGSDYLKEVSIGSDYLKEIGSGSSLLKENNTCQCVPGTSWGTVVSKIVGARVCNSIFKICFELDVNHQ